MSAISALPFRRTILAATLAAAALLAACDDAITAPSAPAPVSSVEVVADGDAITVGEERVMSARLRDASGMLLPDRAVEWSSSDASVASVTSTGRVTAVRAGSATIRARSEGREGTFVVTVQAAPVVSIELLSTHFSLARHQVRQIDAIARDAYGRTITTVAVNWASDDSSVATVSASGQVRAIASGTTRIVARAGGIESSLYVSVPPSVSEVRVTPSANVLSAGSSRQYTAQVLDDRGQVMPGVQVTWSSSTPGVASVSSAGMVSAVSAGYATISARVGAVSGAVGLTVTAASNEWRFEPSLFQQRVLLKADTTVRTAHSLVVVESQLASARLRINLVTGQWSFAAQIVHSERSEFQGNVIYRETGRQTVTDYGTGAEFDVSTGERLLVSAQNSAVRFRFASAGLFANLRGSIGSFPVFAEIPLQY